MMTYSQEKPLNLNEALDEKGSDNDLKLYLIEIGLYHIDDTNTPIDSHYVLVATDTIEDVKDIAVELCCTRFELNNDEHFGFMNTPDEVDISDYK
jgi:hypothetical protein